MQSVEIRHHLIFGLTRGNQCVGSSLLGVGVNYIDMSEGVIFLNVAVLDDGTKWVDSSSDQA